MSRKLSRSVAGSPEPELRPNFASQIIDVFGSARDKSLRPLYVDYLVQYLRQLEKDSNHVVYAALLALHDIGEPIYKKYFSGQSVIEIDKTFVRFTDISQNRRLLTLGDPDIENLKR
jgi:hypothetical protein